MSRSRSPPVPLDRQARLGDRGREHDLAAARRRPARSPGPAPPACRPPCSGSHHERPRADRLPRAAPPRAGSRATPARKTSTSPSSSASARKTALVTSPDLAAVGAPARGTCLDRKQPLLGGDDGSAASLTLPPRAASPRAVPSPCSAAGPRRAGPSRRRHCLAGRGCGGHRHQSQVLAHDGPRLERESRDPGRRGGSARGTR